MTAQTISQDVIDISALNAMLRGELAAVESYNSAIQELKTEPIRSEIERLRDEHELAAIALRVWVHNLREVPSHSSGGMAFREGTMLASLTQAEQLGEATYRQGMGNPDLPDAVRHLIGSRLLPQCLEHARALRALEREFESARERNSPSS